MLSRSFSCNCILLAYTYLVLRLFKGISINIIFVFQVEKYWIHEDFQAQGPYSHDLALLRLQPKGDGCGARYTRSVTSEHVSELMPAP